jgi:GntR family transcriptional regulator/MocR family aminotransferase
MDLFLDGNGPVSRQLFNAIRAAIAEGRLHPGDRLPPSRDLAAAHGVSRGTVVAAYELLRVHGLVESRTGSGTYVARAPENRAPAPEAPPRDPQTSYARRARLAHDHSRIPGRPVAGARIDFQYGMASPPSLLRARWKRLLARARPFDHWGYPPPAGSMRLRKAIAQHIARTRGVVCSPEDVLVVNGVQQATALVCRVLLEPGDVAAVEDPGYFSLRRTLQMHGAQMRGIPVDGEGMQVDKLEGSQAKLVCVTPSHQFPTGVVLSEQRRQALVDFANRTSAWILEDDYDGEFRQDGPALPSLKTMDRDGRVIYAGSFSKTLFAALRLGYMVVPPGLRLDFFNSKWAMDFGCSMLEQTLVAELMESGDYDRHLVQLSRRLREKRQLLLSILNETLGASVEIHPARTGMHLLVWVNGLSNDDAGKIIASAAADGLGLHPVAPCYFSPPPRAGFLMGFGSLSARELAIGARRFADLVTRHLPAGAPRRGLIRLVR